MPRNPFSMGKGKGPRRLFQPSDAPPVRRLQQIATPAPVRSIPKPKPPKSAPGDMAGNWTAKHNAPKTGKGLHGGQGAGVSGLSEGRLSPPQSLFDASVPHLGRRRSEFDRKQIVKVDPRTLRPFPGQGLSTGRTSVFELPRGMVDKAKAAAKKGPPSGLSGAAASAAKSFDQRLKEALRAYEGHRAQAEHLKVIKGASKRSVTVAPRRATPTDPSIQPAQSRLKQPPRSRFTVLEPARPGDRHLYSESGAYVRNRRAPIGKDLIVAPRGSAAYGTGKRVAIMQGDQLRSYDPGRDSMNRINRLFREAEKKVEPAVRVQKISAHERRIAKRKAKTVVQEHYRGAKVIQVGGYTTASGKKVGAHKRRAEAAYRIDRQLSDLHENITITRTLKDGTVKKFYIRRPFDKEIAKDLVPHRTGGFSSNFRRGVKTDPKVSVQTQQSIKNAQKAQRKRELRDAEMRRRGITPPVRSEPQTVLGTDPISGRPIPLRPPTVRPPKPKERRENRYGHLVKYDAGASPEVLTGRSDYNLSRPSRKRVERLLRDLANE